MKSLAYIAAALAVMGLAFWAYTENYATQSALKEVRRLHWQIGAAHQRLTVLNAEWAYLNRPERLRDLADLNYDRLELMPLLPDHFGSVEQVAFPPPPIVEDAPIEASATSQEEPL